MTEERRVGNFEDMVRWCKANGWDERDFDFDRLEARILEIDDRLNELAAGQDDARGDVARTRSPKNGPSPGKIVFFARKLPRRPV